MKNLKAKAVGRSRESQFIEEVYRVHPRDTRGSCVSG
jgi:hypothetical protein